jgi:RNA recognition motif-containing protein
MSASPRADSASRPSAPYYNPPSSSAVVSHSHSSPVTFTLFVGDLSRNARESDLHEAFQRFGPIASVSILKDKKFPHLSQGCGFVNFLNDSSLEQASKAEIIICGQATRHTKSEKRDTLVLTGPVWSSDTADIQSRLVSLCGVPMKSLELKGSSCYCIFSSFQDCVKAFRALRGSSFDSAQLQIKCLLDKSSSDPCTLFIRNLHPSTSEFSLVELFSSHATVMKLTIMKDSEGLSKCFGFTTLSSVEECQRIISLYHGTKVDGNVIEVKFAERANKDKEREKGNFEYRGKIENRRKFDQQEVQRIGTTDSKYQRESFNQPARERIRENHVDYDTERDRFAYDRERPRESRDYRDPRDSRDFRAPRDPLPPPPRDTRDYREVRDFDQSRPSRDHEYYERYRSREYEDYPPSYPPPSSAPLPSPSYRAADPYYDYDYRRSEAPPAAPANDPYYSAPAYYPPTDERYSRAYPPSSYPPPYENTLSHPSSYAPYDNYRYPTDHQTSSPSRPPVDHSYYPPAPDAYNSSASHYTQGPPSVKRPRSPPPASSYPPYDHYPHHDSHPPASSHYSYDTQSGPASKRGRQSQ